jgi:amino acid transporter
MQPAVRDVGHANSSADGGACRGFGFIDVVGIVVGIVVGTAIFKSPTLVFQSTPSPGWAIGLWAVGGFLSLCGALCYAELATAYPGAGGDYEYLSRAYGRGMGLLFGWAQLTVILSSSIAAMAYAFGDYAVRAFGLDSAAVLWLAAGAVAAVSALNACGMRAGTNVQNLLSAAKVIGLTAIVAAGLFVWTNEPLRDSPAVAGSSNMGLALVFVLYAYGGWNDAVFVAAEVRQPRRNLAAALLAGVVGVTTIYVLVNAAILAALGVDAARTSHAPAADALQRAMGPAGERLVSLLVAASALGAINGMIITGTRVYARLGADHRAFAWLGRWSHRAGAPTHAIVAQALVAIAFILSIGTSSGRRLIDGALAAVRLPAIPWEEYFGGFETLVAATAPVFWAFFLMTGLSVFILRWRDPQRSRPFQIPLYPAPLLIFCLSCGFMLYASVDYARWLTALGVVPLLAGLPFALGPPRHSAGAP